ncbi:hypothetical protein KY308_02110 [Candidatus Woesearchaeota archaeon]|nr:hypothetical protein [Candidatus Woesearchaeota archaeon]
MKKLIWILLFLYFSAAVSALSVEFKITAEGYEKVSFQTEAINQTCTFDEETNTTDCINETIIINETKKEPWTAEQNVEVSCEQSCDYQIPKFIIPAEVTIREYIIDYDDSKNYTVTFKSTDSSSTKNPDDKVHIEIKRPDTILEVQKIVPRNLTIGENELTILVKNVYDLKLYSVGAEISGQGIRTLDVSEAEAIAPGEIGYVFLTVNATESGTKDVVMKFTAEASFQKISLTYIDKFAVLPSKNLPENKPETENISATQLSEELVQLKNQLKDYEMQYLEKKSEGYLVSEIYDLIKDVRDNLQSAQLALADNKYKDVQKYFILARSGLEDIDSGLQNVRKTQKTFADKLKDNALLITTTSAAIAAILGLVERSKVKKLKEKLEKRAKERVKPSNEKEETKE